MFSSLLSALSGEEPDTCARARETDTAWARRRPFNLVRLTTARLAPPSVSPKASQFVSDMTPPRPPPPKVVIM